MLFRSLLAIRPQRLRNGPGQLAVQRPGNVGGQLPEEDPLPERMVGFPFAVVNFEEEIGHAREQPERSRPGRRIDQRMAKETQGIAAPRALSFQSHRGQQVCAEEGGRQAAICYDWVTTQPLFPQLFVKPQVDRPRRGTPTLSPPTCHPIVTCSPRTRHMKPSQYCGDASSVAIDDGLFGVYQPGLGVGKPAR